MVKNTLKKHYLMKELGVGREFTVNNNSANRLVRSDIGVTDYIHITITRIGGDVIYYSSVSSVECYNRTIGSTSLSNAKDLIKRDYWQKGKI